MEWSEKHDVVLCREVLLMEPYQHPYRSKERGDVWNQIALNLNGLDDPKFTVNKRSVRDRLTLLITKHKAKMRQEENASGIACEETELDRALEEIIDKEKLSNEKSSEAKNKEKEEKAAAEEHRKRAMERLEHLVCFKDLQLYLPIIDNKVLLLHQLREILASSIELFKEDPTFKLLINIVTINGAFTS